MIKYKKELIGGTPWKTPVVIFSCTVFAGFTKEAKSGLFDQVFVIKQNLKENIWITGLILSVVDCCGRGYTLIEISSKITLFFQ